LPLITDILDRVGKRKVFTKLDLRWEYNNVIVNGHLLFVMDALIL